MSSMLLTKQALPRAVSVAGPPSLFALNPLLWTDPVLPRESCVGGKV